MKSVNSEVYQIAWEYVFLMNQGEINDKYLKSICETLAFMKIETREEAVDFIKYWRKNNLGRKYRQLIK
jgi:replication initiation and membrane attachment protein DnaB